MITLTNDIRDPRSFRSYIEEDRLESVNLNAEQRTKLLDGETLACEVQKVTMFTPLSDKKKYVSGVLSVTTFKVSFVSTEDDDYNVESCYQQNSLLGPNDICLSNIDCIYNITDHTKRRLTSVESIPGKIKELLIICKNMRVFEFSFKYSDKDSGRKVAKALLHHSDPKHHYLLFAYEYKEPSCNTTLIREVRLFHTNDDWRKEMERTKCQNWRISTANSGYQISPLLCEVMIVPKSVTDSVLIQAVEHFQHRFCPIWVFGTPEGAALVRTGDLLPTIKDRTQENVLLEHIRKSHPQKTAPCLLDLGKECPSPKEVQASYLKLRDLCMPDSTKNFKSEDFKFYGLLDATKWLMHVSNCLTVANKAANKLHKQKCTIVLQEGTGQDMNCIISCLVQIIIDPNYRTKYGFQSLIQKEWVALGHHFSHRLGHILSKEVEMSPLFLLFLDCVWQLLQQYPQAFEFSETYLTTLWDSAHITVFETFLFNCERDRAMAERGCSSVKPLTLRSVWDWNEQFNDKDIALFFNPLYDNALLEMLCPDTAVSGLDVWSQCYFRWLPVLEIINGGKPQIDLSCRFLVTEILRLQKQVNNRETNGRIEVDLENSLELLRKVNSFFPFSSSGGQYSGAPPINNVLLTGDTLDSQSILNLNND